ncbi:MotA/TolQ/ExbB proton channel family protein [Albimonas sp. CAU 1670]|uniref:MotA/TolQ/ExbB proton channel family protein n=1 Tax=Albimonas sp. CAU 1670 TaxID=3032599 RepID=UPI0023D9EF52|nr:MotA/TolQ/ExbB proton channel family protein [Albimonas sp. CAU 1670]MDF2232069.1 MotA/TolQ/ExbB proton channel family protein [Albimonas sp. CAU 1670]
MTGTPDVAPPALRVQAASPDVSPQTPSTSPPPDVPVPGDAAAPGVVQGAPDAAAGQGAADGAGGAGAPESAGGAGAPAGADAAGVPAGQGAPEAGAAAAGAPVPDPMLPAGTGSAPGPEAHDALAGAAGDAWGTAARMLHDGGPAVWAIAALSVVTVALILWKLWTLLRLGAWSRARSERAIAAYREGGPAAGLAALRRRPGLRGRMLRAGFHAVAALPPEAAREETARVARRELAEARTGLRALELIATAAPLLGLLGTVLGMIAAFRTLQEAGGRADPAMLAGGIWEALLTTAAGMAVAIPASAALTWFESVADRARQDMEDLGTRLFLPSAVRPADSAADAASLPSRADAA